MPVDDVQVFLTRPEISKKKTFSMQQEGPFMASTKTYSLYLFKDTVKELEDIFSENSAVRIKAGDVTLVDSDQLGDEATLFIFQNPPKPPNWMKDVASIFAGVVKITNKTSCAVVAFKRDNRIFATTFAHGWQFLDDTKLVSDFGLMVAVNSIDDAKLKRIDRSHLGEGIKGVAQSAFHRTINSFGVDDALDLIRKVTGQVEDGGFASSLSGATSLKITSEMTLADISDVAVDALRKYESKKYLTTGFQILEKVKPIIDPTKKEMLDEAAVKSIASGKDFFELAMPGWSEDDVVYYGLYGAGLRGRFPDLLMSNYREALGPKALAKLDVSKITKNHGVIAELNNDAQTKKRWSIKKALVGSQLIGTELYAAAEGEWYQLDELFKTGVETAVDQLREEWPEPPLKIIQKIQENSNKSGFESEFEYNTRSAAASGYLCMDQKNIQVKSVPYGRFEACDILDIEGRRLIHVKKSSRQSSVLSHFFKQGSNSAKILKLYPDAREKLVDHVRRIPNEIAADALEAAMKNGMTGWKIEFHIIDAPRKDGTFTVPFFSRISLREEARDLESMNYKVSLRFIPH